MRQLPLIAAAMLTLVASPATSQPAPAQRGEDCLAQGLTEARFSSRPLGDGRYLYQLDLANRGHRAIRYSYSFALPGSTRPAEALNGYLTPGTSTEHALGAGDRSLTAEALRAGTTLRCFPM